MKSFKDWLIEATMDPKTVLQIFGLAEFPKTAVELKTLYKKLALANHPDRGGSLEKMQDINAANDVLKNWIGRSVKNLSGGGGTSAGRAGSTARSYRQAGETFRTSRERAQANRDAAAADTLKNYGPMWEAILKCLKGGAEGCFDFFKCITHLTSIFGEPFTHIEKAATIQEISRMKDRAKQSWVSHLFVNKSRTLIFEIELIGDSDHMAWRMRHTPTGYENSKNFDFEWTFALNVWKGSPAERQVLTRRTKYRRADLNLLRDPKKMLPIAKLKKVV